MIFVRICPVLILFTSVYTDGRGRRIKRIVGGNPADPPPEDDPSVFVNFAGRSALIRGIREFPHYVFRGIHYAHAPVGKDRFLVSLYFNYSTLFNKLCKYINLKTMV